MKTLNKLKIFMIAFVAIVSVGTVRAQCTASFNAVDNGNGNYTFTSTSVGGQSTWWSIDGTYYAGTPNGLSNSFVNGTYIVCVTIEDSVAGCFDQTCQTIVVTSGVSCNLVADFYASETNGVATFTSTSTGNFAFVTYDYGDGTVGSSVTHTYTTNGAYYACLTIEDSLGFCSDTHCDSVIVTGSAGTPCVYVVNSYDSLGYTYFTTTGNNGSSYFWDFGDGNTSATTFNGISHQYPTNGYYYYCVTIDSCNPVCDSILVSYNNTPCNLAASFTITDNGNGNYSFTNNSTGALNYSWNFGDGTNSSATNPNHTFLANGTYTVVLGADDLSFNNSFGNYCYDYATVTINVTGVANPVSCNAGFVTYTDSNLFNGVIVINSSTGNNLTYFWNFGDGNTSTQQYPSYIYSTAGPFNLCLTVSDSNNSCSSTYCDSIGSNGIVFKGAGFSVNVQAPVVTGIANQVETVTDVNLYPNPVKDNLTIELGLNEVNNVEVFVTDLLGNTVSVIANQQMNSGSNQLQWKISNVPNGIYLLHIKTENSLEVKKLIVNK